MAEQEQSVELADRIEAAANSGLRSNNEKTGELVRGHLQTVLSALRGPDAVNADKAVAAITGDELGEIMQEEWGEICEDTQCHPLDMDRQGRKLFYNPRHWTAAIARRLSERTPAPDKALMPEAAVGVRCNLCGTVAPTFFGKQCNRPECSYRTPTSDEEPEKGATGEELHQKHPQAYSLMLGFYCDTDYYNSSPDCRPADNVLMAIQYALEHAQIEVVARAIDPTIWSWEPDPENPDQVRGHASRRTLSMDDARAVLADVALTATNAGQVEADRIVRQRLLAIQEHGNAIACSSAGQALSALKANGDAS